MRPIVPAFCLLTMSGVACGPSAAEKGSTQKAPAAVEKEESQVNETKDDVDPYAPTYGPPVEVEALYLVEPIPGGKRLQAVLLRLDDGREWIRSYRPVPEELQFFEKRVVVKGRTYQPSPMVQHVGGTHFELDSIALAASEVPHDPIPTQVPSPPVVEGVADIATRDLLWVQVHGTLEGFQAEESNTFWGDGTMKLLNGETIPLRGLSRSKTEHLVGKPITALGRSLKGQLSGRIVVCENHVDNCGATPDRRKRVPIPPE